MKSVLDKRNGSALFAVKGFAPLTDFFLLIVSNLILSIQLPLLTAPPSALNTINKL